MPPTFPSHQVVYSCSQCGKKCLSSRGLTQHMNAYHRACSPDSSDNDISLKAQWYVSLETTTAVGSNVYAAWPCDEAGNDLPPYSPPPPVPPQHGNSGPWHPFEDRISFDFASYHFVEVQSSADKIEQVLNHWAASWMTETYELCCRDTRRVLHQQLSMSDFKDKINLTPYQQFNSSGKRVYSNLMSGDWAWNHADIIAEDPATHGSMFVPIIAGSDKTTVSVATGHQEYHPVYMSPGNVTNIACRAHGNSVLPVAFLPIPKTKRRHRNTVPFQRFARQMYHTCLTRVFDPLKPGMMTPDVVHCPDGHFWQAIYGMGPYIADYPEQVWLAALVQGWCPKCDAPPHNLDSPEARPRSHKKTEMLIQCFDPRILWDDYGIRSDVVPFTEHFPRANIHELLSPDLLHQVIKGTFKDHIVTWVNEYLHIVHGEARGNEIIDDIDRRISLVPSFPGLRCFPDGRDFTQWTGDDSKALMKVYITAITGHIPSEMVKCVAAFLDFCYIVRRNAICTDTLERAMDALRRFHQYRDIFIQTGVRPDTISLPRQHSLKHYLRSIRLFGSPNGLCSSITESKHIPAVKKPWRRSSHFNALGQMLLTNQRMDKMHAIRCIFTDKGMMDGTTLSYTARMLRGEEPAPPANTLNDEDDTDDHGAVRGPKVMAFVVLAATAERSYPRYLSDLAKHINQPKLPEHIWHFLYNQLNPDSANFGADMPLHECPFFDGRVSVYHSAMAHFYAPSDLCGAGGMYHERIRSTPLWRGEYARRDTIFVETDPTLSGMPGMVVGQVFLFFSFTFRDVFYPCALIHWFERVGRGPDSDTGLWVVKPEYERNGRPSLTVIHIDSIPRAAHLARVYGSGLVPEDIHFSDSLDIFRTYFVNSYANHHTNEFLS
ncbi:hypothetical protein BJV74DRAFT_876167 [Russula compacta]|nr:hypothetical protein BJV74DRAFT_876167 [Russula compacta]